MKKCAWPDCHEEGAYRAPCDPRDLSKVQYFCAAHIKEFNKNWNGLKGFNTAQINAMQVKTGFWNKPTWPLGTGSTSEKRAQFSFDSAHDLYQFFKERIRQNQPQPAKSTPTRKMPPKVLEACETLALKQPPGRAQLRRVYLKLVKENHPDLNKDRPQAEDRLKRINAAYKVLDEYAAKQV